MPHQPDESIPPKEEENLDLSAPLKGDGPPGSNWVLIAHNKRVLRDWEQIVRNRRQNAINAYDRLRMDAMTASIPKRCFALKHKNYAGCWCYEIGDGDRLYYKPNAETRRAIVYYAGPHPKDGVPLPPRDL